MLFQAPGENVAHGWCLIGVGAGASAAVAPIAPTNARIHALKTHPRTLAFLKDRRVGETAACFRIIPI
jgi:hypothetical protein